MRQTRTAGLACGIAAVAIAAAAAAPARADDAAAHPPPAAAPAPDADNIPVFPDLDRVGPSSRFGVEVTYVHLKSTGAADPDHLFHTNVYIAARVSPAIGAYAQLPFTFAWSGGDAATALGGLELGGYFLAREVAPGITLVPHAGFVLPNATKGTDGELALYGGFVRLNDLVQGLPRGATLRAGISGLARTGRAFFRLDFDLDANVYEAGSANNDTFPTVLRIDGGVGYDEGDVALAFESNNVVVLPKDGLATEHLHNLSLSVAGSSTAQRVHPYLALTVPISNDDSSGFYNFAITAGLAIHLQQ